MRFSSLQLFNGLSAAGRSERPSNNSGKPRGSKFLDELRAIDLAALWPQRIRLPGLMFTPFAVQLGVAVAVTMGLSYVTAGSIINQLTRDLGNQIGERVLQEIGHQLNQPRQVNAINTKLINSGLISPESILKLGPLLHTQMELFPGLGYIQAGSISGAYIDVERNQSGSELIQTEQPPGNGDRPLRRWVLSPIGIKLQELPPKSQNVRDYVWFRQGLASSGTENTYVQSYGPVNAPLGVFSSDIWPKQISVFLQHMDIGRDAAVMIVDRQGYLVASSTDDDIYRIIGGKLVRQPLLSIKNPLLRGMAEVSLPRFDSDFSQRALIDGKSYMLVTKSWKDLSGTAWQVVVATPEDNYLASAKSTLRTSFLVLALSALVMVLVSRITSGLVSSPLQRIALAADSMAKGDLDQRLSSSAVDEVNDLTLSFNSMAGQLRASYGDLEAQKNYTDSILESMPSAVITLDDDGVIRRVNEAAARIFRQAPLDIVGQKANSFFGRANGWLVHQLSEVRVTGNPYTILDAELAIGEGKTASNISVQPLVDPRMGTIGTMLMVEDITDEKRMKGTMARYMDPLIAEELMRDGADSLGGVENLATVLFSDIRKFTSLTEALGAQGTVSLLNEYFTLMVDCLQQEGGMLDKFIGDSVMAIFGLPKPAEGDEDRAMRTGIEMIRQLDLFNQRRAEVGLDALQIGIGLHTDQVVSGNIGSPKRMNYTVIGDGVNLAARIESACRQYGTRMLISDSTAKRLRGSYRLREADLVVVKGKTEPAVIHEVLDFYSETTFPQLNAVLNYYQQGLNFYRQQRWNEAIAAFGKALEYHPGDRLSAIYVQRAQTLQANPPGENWDGVWVLQDK